MKPHIQLLRETAEYIAGLECTFWACPGPFNANGQVRRRTQAMRTCSGCQQVIEINNHVIKATGTPLTFVNLTPTTDEDRRY